MKTQQRAYKWLCWHQSWLPPAPWANSSGIVVPLHPLPWKYTKELTSDSTDTSLDYLQPLEQIPGVLLCPYTLCHKNTPRSLQVTLLTPAVTTSSPLSSSLGYSLALTPFALKAHERAYKRLHSHQSWLPPATWENPSGNFLIRRVLFESLGYFLIPTCRARKKSLGNLYSSRKTFPNDSKINLSSFQIGTLDHVNVYKSSVLPNKTSES